MANVTVYVPDDLWEQYKRLRESDPETKPASAIMQEGVKREIKKRAK